MTTKSPTTKIFIVGVGRSGTSLLQSMVGSHSEIEFLPETGFLRRFVVPEKLAKTKATQGMDGVYRLLEQDERLARLELPWNETIVSDETKHLDLRIYEHILNSKSNSASFVGDKDPKLIETIDLILNLWPDSKIIHIYRDPRDVLLSKKKASWSKGRSTSFHLIASNVQFQLGEYFEQKFGTQSIHTVGYEDLVQQPEEKLVDLCEWLGVEFEPGMLDFGKTASKLVSSEELQWKGETLGPLLQSNSKKWATELSTFESRLTERSCSQALKRGEYERDVRPSGIATSLVTFVWSAGIRLIANFYMRWQLRKNKSVVQHYGG